MKLLSKNLIIWIAKLLAAIIMLQTLFFKFSGADESVYIFTKVGIEPWGRFGIGIAELIAALLILIPSSTLFGAILAIGIMGGALISHLVVLGIEVNGDGGQLFIYALIVFICSIYLVWENRFKLTTMLRFKKNSV